MKANNPGARVISGGTAGIEWRFIDSLGVNGALKKVEGVGIHPCRMGSPESFSEDLRWLLKKHRPGGFPEWATEYGAANRYACQREPRTGRYWPVGAGGAVVYAVLPKF